jgi:dTDP-4-dehydrorhamnose reductase
MVFSSDQQGPFDHEREPQAVEGYGFEKRSMEAVIATSGTNSVVVRLGWQIGSQAGSNNMVDFLERQFASDGVIRASPSWYPSCSHLDETAEFLWAAKDISPGIYQFSTNRGQSFYDIVQGLKYKLDRADWRLVADTELSGNQLMIDRRIDRFCHELDTSSSLRNVMDA